MNNYSQIDSLIKLSNDMIVKADKINHRLVNAVVIIAIAFSISFSVTAIGVSYLYFATDYSYPSVNQSVNQSDNNNSKVEIIKGVNK